MSFVSQLTLHSTAQTRHSAVDTEFATLSPTLVTARRATQVPPALQSQAVLTTAAVMARALEFPQTPRASARWHGWVLIVQFPSAQWDRRKRRASLSCAAVMEFARNTMVSTSATAMTTGQELLATPLFLLSK